MLQTIGDLLLTLAGRALFFLAVSPVVDAIGWEVWQGLIRPRLIPESEIAAIADELVLRYGDRAEEIAFINEDRAWRYSDSFEQGKWQRVRLKLEGR